MRRKYLAFQGGGVHNGGPLGTKWKPPFKAFPRRATRRTVASLRDFRGENARRELPTIYKVRFREKSQRIDSTRADSCDRNGDEWLPEGKGGANAFCEEAERKHASVQASRKPRASRSELVSLAATVVLPHVTRDHAYPISMVPCVRTAADQAFRYRARFADSRYLAGFGFLPDAAGEQNP